MVTIDQPETPLLFHFAQTPLSTISLRMTLSGKNIESSIQFSIVLPLYNKAQSIERTVKTILGQSHSGLELIIVNDGSTDGSEKLIENFNDPRIVLLTQKNQGVSVARNTGIHAAKHDLVAFIDGDDMWHRDYLATIAALYKMQPDSHGYSTGWTAWKKEVPVPEDRVVFDKNKINQLDYVKESINEVVIHICSLVVKRKSAISIGGFPEGIWFLEDQDFCCRLAEKGLICNYQQALVYYVKDAENRACVSRSVVNDMPPYYRSCEPIMLLDHALSSRDWYLKEYLITRYLSEFSFASQTPGQKRKALRWWLLCRRTKLSRLRLWKGAIYLMIPSKALRYFISRVPSNFSLQAK